MSWAVGVDIGGTNIRVAQVTDSGAVGNVLTEPLDALRSGGRALGQLTDMIGALLEKSGPEHPAGIGVGATGPVDPRQGVISNQHTLPEPFRGRVGDGLHAEFGVPVRLENDADAAVAGESWLSPGAGAEVFACITIGTGIGGGVIHNGKIFRGPDGWHPEFGHHVVDPSGPLCYCGAHGCVESIASAPAVARAAVEAGLAPAGAQAPEVFAAAEQDERCRAIVDRAHGALATAALNIVATHAPQELVLAGNGIGHPGALLARIRQRLDSYVFTPPGGVRVRLSELGGMAGCIGAARLILEPGVWS
jgi:glucokinase